MNLQFVVFKLFLLTMVGVLVVSCGSKVIKVATDSDVASDENQKRAAAMYVKFETEQGDKVPDCFLSIEDTTRLFDQRVRIKLEKSSVSASSLKLFALRPGAHRYQELECKDKVFSLQELPAFEIKEGALNYLGRLRIVIKRGEVSASIDQGEKSGLLKLSEIIKMETFYSGYLSELRPKQILRHRDEKKGVFVRILRDGDDEKKELAYLKDRAQKVSFSHCEQAEREQNPLRIGNLIVMARIHGSRIINISTNEPSGHLYSDEYVECVKKTVLIQSGLALKSQDAGAIITFIE
ncbi:MAG: hypothetical protein HQK52_05635 [Oligoflexia bacterium]|nr:hypothetical protein [Oligoflexia bacterium]